MCVIAENLHWTVIVQPPTANLASSAPADADKVCTVNVHNDVWLDFLI